MKSRLEMFGRIFKYCICNHQSEMAGGIFMRIFKVGGVYGMDCDHYHFMGMGR